MTRTHAVRAGRMVALVALLAFGLLLAASGAQAAGCALPYKSAVTATIPFVSPRADQQEGPADESNASPSIVGLWHLNYTAEAESGAPIFPPAPFPFLESFKTWHADGTEFENAFLPPGGGNICFGVWKDLGHGSVKLHHIGLMFDSLGNVSNIFTVDEIDTVARNGQSYSGHFDFKLWPPSYSAVGVGLPIAEVAGNTQGTRINVD